MNLERLGTLHSSLELDIASDKIDPGTLIRITGKGFRYLLWLWTRLDLLCALALPFVFALCACGCAGVGVGVRGKRVIN
jgi:hypothetical protein